MTQRRRWAPKLWACVLGITGIVAGAGPADAQPDPSPPIVPSIIDQLVTSTPALSVDPSDDGGPAVQWGGVGMICQNLTVRCR